MAKVIFSLIALTASATIALGQECIKASDASQSWLVTFEQDGKPVEDCKGALVPIEGNELETDIVVTTVHCARKTEEGGLTVVAGVKSSRDSTNKQVAKANQMSYHPLYEEQRKAGGPNIALLILDKQTPIKINSPAIQPLCLTSPGEQDLDGILSGLKDYAEWVTDEAILQSQASRCGGGAASNPVRPWLAALEKDNWRDTKCFGNIALLPVEGKESETDIVITTGYCAKKALSEGYEVIAFGDTEQKVKPERVIYHPLRSPLKIQHDIAIIKLAAPIMFKSGAVEPLCLASPAGQLNKILYGLSNDFEWVKNQIAPSLAAAVIQKQELEPKGEVGALTPNKFCSDAGADQRPWLVTFERDGSPVPDCNGALVPVEGNELQTDVVVTTVNCARQIENGELTVVAGVKSSGDSTDKQLAKANRISYHPLYEHQRKAGGPNIALLILDKQTPIKINSPAVQPLCLTSGEKDLDGILSGLKDYAEWVTGEAVLQTSAADCGDGAGSNPVRPWLAAIEKDNWRDTNCFGNMALLQVEGKESETDIVLTTGACAKKALSGGYEVIAFGNAEQKVKPERAFYHPLRSPFKMQHDIAIIKLAAPIMFKAHAVEPLCLASPARQLNKILYGLNNDLDWVKTQTKPSTGTLGN